MGRVSTTVKNVSGHRRYFTYVPPHGYALDNNQEITLDYDLFAALTPSGSKLWDDSLLQALYQDMAASPPVVEVTTLDASAGDNAGEAGDDAESVSVTGNETTKKVTLTFDDVVIPTTEATTDGGFGGLEIYTLPQGLVYILGATTDFTVAVTTGIGATATLKHALGTTVEASDDTLDSTSGNILPSTGTSLSSSAGVAKGVSTTPLVINGTSSAGKVFLNFGVADAGSSANSTVTINGTISFTFVFLGDN